MRRRLLEQRDGPPHAGQNEACAATMIRLMACAYASSYSLATSEKQNAAISGLRGLSPSRRKSASVSGLPMTMSVLRSSLGLCAFVTMAIGRTGQWDIVASRPKPPIAAFGSGAR